MTLENHFHAELQRRREKALTDVAAQREAEAAKVKSPARLRLEQVLLLLQANEQFIDGLGLKLVDRENEIAIEAPERRISINLSTGRYQVTLLSTLWHIPPAPRKKTLVEVPLRSGIALPLDAEDCEWFDTPEQVEERVAILLAKMIHQNQGAEGLLPKALED